MLGFAAEQRVHADIINIIAGHEMNKVDALLTQIAQRVLRIETLESRRRDSLDFHEVSVWELRDALEAAYNAGIEQRRKAAGKGKSSN
jgi:c-di-GMP-binding flagellar brake protein YcgR